MNDKLDTKNILKAIETYLEEEMNKAFDKAFDEIVERVRNRRSEIVSTVTLNMLREFNIERYGENITITVKDQAR